MRALPKAFFGDLKNEEGMLRPILERVKVDHTLMLAIRDGYINIYYRGGNILRIAGNPSKRSYQATFDEKYNMTQLSLPPHPTPIGAPEDAATWVKAFPVLKEVMDYYFSTNQKPEREFQQLVARENNNSTISNETEYFISDIEFADSDLHARFDMLGIRWLASSRKSGSNCRAALIEMKYGDGALDKKSGLVDHLKKIDDFIYNADSRFASLLDTMALQFNQLQQLDLLDFNRCSNGTSVKLSAKDKHEVIILLANHNPRSQKLRDIVNDTQIDEYAKKDRYDLRFHVAQFSGYGLHSDCMLSLADFRKLLQSI
jgi:hypothetical protein